ncbi:hypothetical protein [Brevundimonas sp.]|uniref:hypothetical protein n=1 Tax=Brevundimonas sp. TaxID=1871086 RepID=UPI002D6CA6FF|nr:hypothetical protein [Brevundimonas sp.]HYC74258.1 hypothetical protein [Brevundimonas sp.]
MRRVISAALAAVALLAAVPATAQIIIVPEAQGEAAIRHSQLATATAQKVTSLMLAVVNDPGYVEATSPDDLAAYIDANRARIASTRAEIRRLKAELDALPTVGRPSDPPQIRISDQVVDDIAVFCGNIDDLLGDVLALGDALKSGDGARSQRVAMSLMRGSIAVVDAQSLMLRSRLPLMGSDTSAYHRVSAMACFYDAMAAYQRGEYEFVTRSEAAGKVAEAEACMRERIAASQTFLRIEAVAPPPRADLIAMRDQLTAVYAETLTQLTKGADLLGEAQSVMARGDLEAFNLPLTERVIAFEAEMQRLTIREVDVVASTQGL